MRLGGGTGPSAKSRRQKAGRSKPHKKAITASRSRGPSAAESQKQLDALAGELREAREQQAATAGVLKAISSSTFDLQSVLDTLTESAARLCGADMATICREDATGVFHAVTNYNFLPEWVEYNKSINLQPGRGSVVGRVLLEGKPVQVADVFADPEYAFLEAAKKGGWRTFLGVPLLRKGNPIGIINLARKTVAPFTDSQIELVSTFADQAVIAIENARLFEDVQARTRELAESLQQQTATADVLKVISQSTFKLQPIFDTIVEAASHLCNAETALIFMFREEKLHLVATNNASDAFINYLTTRPLLPERGSLAGRAFVEQKTVHIADCLADPEYTVLDYQTIGKYRSMLGVPLLREGLPIGVISLLRTVVKPFTDRQIDLVETFADQAVIAIENVRLFEAEQQRTRELTESLQQQTATADVLKVISRSTFDLQAVLDTLVESAVRLCEADAGHIARPNEAGFFQTQAHFGHSTELKEGLNRIPFKPGRGSVTGRALLELKTVQIADAQTDPEYKLSELQELGGNRSMIGTPLLREGVPIGVFGLARFAVRPFTDKQMALLTTFADQAVIAIENVRLFEAEQQRTRELTEALDRQTATAEVLNVISRSTAQLQPVLDTIVQTASRLCNAEIALIFMLREKKLRVVATNNASDAFVQHAIDHPLPLGRGSCSGRSVFERQVIHIPDCLADPDYTFLDYQAVGKYRSMLGVPLLSDGAPIGVITLLRTAVMPFTEKQIDLVKTFADQAVIAIENVRLFEAEQQRTRELTESLQQQTATAEVLKVISRSTFDLQTVLDTLMESATRLCDADHAWLFEREDEGLRWVASFGHATEVHEQIKEHFLTLLVPLDRGSVSGRTTLEGRVVHVPDVLTDPEYVWSGALKAQEIGNYRAALGVPLLRQGQVVGVIFITKTVPEPFTAKQIEVVTTFADQAVIAIENTRLLNELRESLQQQTATADVLKVISRSTFDLPTVLDALLRSAGLLCEADMGAVLRPQNERFIFAASFNLPPAFVDLVKELPIEAGRGTVAARVIAEGSPAQIPDVLADPEYVLNEAQSAAGYRTILGIPLLREGIPIGILTLMRSHVRPFTDKQIELVSTFADQAVIAIENARLFDEVRARTDELSESLRQQTATAEVLEVISRSAFDLQPVFDTVAESSVQLCDAERAIILRYDGELLRVVAAFNASPEHKEWTAHNPIRPGRHSAAARAALERRTVHIPDVQVDPEYTYGARDIEPVRTVLGVPMLKGDDLLGVIIIYRLEVRPFTDKQIALVETFADQSAIAIENARLFEEVQQRTRDLSESLEQQTATAEVLKVISSSPGELEPVFDAILENAVQICGAKFGVLVLFEGDSYKRVALHSAPAAYVEAIARDPVRPLAKSPLLSRVATTKQVIQVTDMDGMGDIARLGGARTILGVPMLKDNRVVGAISIFRQEARPFTDKQTELVANFSAQAVIAIENTRLLNELRESLQQQTATSDVLKVISRSAFDLQAVLDTLVKSAVQLCEADIGHIARPNEAGFFQTQAHFGFSTELKEELGRTPFKPDRGSVTSRALLERTTVQIVDAETDPEYKLSKAQRLGGYRSMIGTPLLREGTPIGVFGLARYAVRPFTDKQMALLTTFADQAVIAIENARLFDEVRVRTDELSEALRQQTATADVLQVISGSAFDLQPVFDTVAESSVRLCEAERALIWRYDGELLRMVAAFNSPPEFKEWLAQHPLRPGRHSAAARAALERRTIDIPDVQVDPEYSYGAKDVKAVRTVLAVPILKGDDLLGVVVIYRFEVRPFTDKQIALVETFADQSAIAIENVRLFEEVQQRTEALTESLRQQTATADVLKVISRSAFDLPTVLRTLVESAAQLCEADKTTIIRQKGDAFCITEAYGFSPEFIEAVKDLPIEPTSGLASGRALLEGHVVHIPDVEADPEYTFTAKGLGDYRTVLAVPMLREDEAIGVLVLTRSDVRPFTDKQIETASTFADQAAIAIENVRLFESVETRTRELATSLEELRTAQDRLVQTEKLASLGQLTAGIAHEIKNPLNFVNNFSALAIELIGELKEALQAARLDDKVNAQIAELADMLKGNLGKVIEHGKRADSIVKNMLLHSRQEAGEHRPVEINALVAESLNLAYHGARAAKQGFNITLEQSLDPAAGVVDVFPQEITRVVLNLISNGFYAAAKRKAETNSETYEPTLTASTRNLGDSVEIRIRDNGTGIPAEVKEKMFSPFFTTKPAGEGTGLGLSLSYDIIVKQHGGSIKVDTQPGEFTEFTIVLPRVATSVANSGERR